MEACDVENCENPEAMEIIKEVYYTFESIKNDPVRLENNNMTIEHINKLQGTLLTEIAKLKDLNYL